MREWWLNLEDNMETFFLWVVVALIPSVAAVAWLTWYSSAFARS
jgi:hypothetical protein